MKGRHEAQALATEPAWGLARALQALGKDGNPSQPVAQVEGSSLAGWAAAIPLSASCLNLFSRGSPGL